MLHQLDVMEIVMLRLKFAVRIDVEAVASKTLEEMNPIPGVDNLLEAFRHMM